MICGNCDMKPTTSRGAGQMQAMRRLGRAYPFCDRRGTEVLPFVLNLTGYAVFKPLTFNRDARLEGKRIMAIEVVGTTAAGKVGGVDNPGGVATGWLTMVRQCGQELEVIAEIPLPLLDRTQNGGKLYFTDMRPKFGSCYVTFSSGSYSEANALQFNFYVEP